LVSSGDMISAYDRLVEILSAIWFTAAISGALAGLVALTVKSVRRPALMVAGSLFALAGVLGILSIGILFIGLAALCFTRLNGIGRSTAIPPPPSIGPSD